jgi:hypothetical protein
MIEVRFCHFYFFRSYPVYFNLIRVHFSESGVRLQIYEGDHISNLQQYQWGQSCGFDTICASTGSSVGSGFRLAS